jgi:peptide-methionine (S)-S-oxide reductase
MEKATFAGGCFWCTEAIFKRVKGVSDIMSGYSGGDKDNPSYQAVSTGDTGHAEAIQLNFDPKIISYSRLLDIFWATHDPTTLNRQGADVGTQYRSVIFYHDEDQKKQAEESKAKMEASGKLNKEIVTEIAPYENFYKAEASHQNFYENNQGGLYCSLVIDPKIQKLITEFNSDVKEEYTRS